MPPEVKTASLVQTSTLSLPRLHPTYCMQFFKKYLLYAAFRECTRIKEFSLSLAGKGVK